MTKEFNEGKKLSRDEDESNLFVFIRLDQWMIVDVVAAAAMSVDETRPSTNAIDSYRHLDENKAKKKKNV